jgi:hypothetical protein
MLGGLRGQGLIVVAMVRFNVRQCGVLHKIKLIARIKYDIERA